MTSSIGSRIIGEWSRMFALTATFHEAFWLCLATDVAEGFAG